MTERPLFIPCRGEKTQAALTLPARKTTKKIVLFSHGYNGRKEDFAEEAAFLAAQGIPALRLTFSGGNADQGEERTMQMSVLTQREELEAAIRLLAAEGYSPLPFGASQGGLVSVLAAQRCADAVCGLALLFPALCIPDDWRRRFPPGSRLPDRLPFWGMTLGKKYFTDVLNTDAFAGMQNFQRPVCIFHGDADEIVPLSYSERAAAAFPQATLFPFHGEGHGFTPAARRKVCELLLTFLRSLPG